MPLTPKQQRFCEEYLINVDRFHSYIDKSAGIDSCWNWQGAKDSQGYGRFHIGISRNSSMLSHRIAYGLYTGEEPEAVCHDCDNPSCCNPAHLTGATRDYNNKDMTAKRRHGAHIDPTRWAKGEKHGSAKLSDGDVVNIREIYSDGEITQRQLANKFNVSQRTVNKIVNNTGWTHV